MSHTSQFIYVYATLTRLYLVTKANSSPKSEVGGLRVSNTYLKYYRIGWVENPIVLVKLILGGYDKEIASRALVGDAGGRKSVWHKIKGIKICCFKRSDCV